MTLYLLQYTLIHTSTMQPTISLPLYSKLDFFSSDISSPFFIPTFLLSWILLCARSVSLLLYQSLLSLTSLSYFCYPISCLSFLYLVILLSPQTILLSFYLLPFLNVLRLLKFAPRSFSVPYSLLPLQRAFFTCFLLLFSVMTSHPLFSLFCSLPVSLSAVPFSFTLGVRSLWKHSPWERTSIRGKKELETNCEELYERTGK